MAIMKSWNGYEIYDEAARTQITNVKTQINGVKTAGTGAAYTATVKGISALTAGVSFIMIPHTVSTNTSPTLNINSLGAKNIRQRVSSSTATTVVGSSADWLAANKPVKVIYDGTYWIVDVTKPDATKLNGVVPVANGGTGQTTLAATRNAMGLGNTTGALPIANGGTGAGNAATALNNLGIKWGTAAAPATGTPNSIYIQIN